LLDLALAGGYFGGRRLTIQEGGPMLEVSGQTAHLQHLVEQLQRGDAAARQELLTSAGDGLLRLTRRMFRGEHRLKRWEQTEDVFQNANLRLYLALAEIKPSSVRDFFRLAALHIRRELIDLARHYYGPQGLGTRQTTQRRSEGHTRSPPAYEQADTADEPSGLATWCEFHEHVASLPEEERELFDLLWYQGLSQSEAAALVGISERSLQRRWQTARLHLHRALHGVAPG
jgi:RNA polymerase sigma factor (sigma-70 family)